MLKKRPNRTIFFAYILAGKLSIFKIQSSLFSECTTEFVNAQEMEFLHMHRTLWNLPPLTVSVACDPFFGLVALIKYLSCEDNKPLKLLKNQPSNKIRLEFHHF